MTGLCDVTCHIGSHSRTCYPTQVNMSHPNPSPQADTRFTYPGGMKVWVDPTPSSGCLTMQRPGIEVATFRSQVWRPNHYTTEPRRVLSWCWLYCWRYVGVTLQNQYGPGNSSTQIWLDEVECIGYESSLEECQHNSWGYHNCVHQEDVSISCNSLDDCKFISSLNSNQQSKCISLNVGWEDMYHNHQFSFRNLAHMYIIQVIFCVFTVL